MAADRIQVGDCTPAIWRSPELAEAAYKYASHPQQSSTKATGLSAQAKGQLLRGPFEQTITGTAGSFPILKSKGADSQTAIQSIPDESWTPKKRDEEVCNLNDDTHPEVKQILEKAGYLLVSAGKRTNTARLAATAGEEKYVGNGWMPVTGLSPQEAKAAVFSNSTVGRLQFMRTPGKTLDFPTCSVAEAENIKIPDIKGDRIRQTLVDCLERTEDLTVPQYRDGESEVRELWDQAADAAMDWDPQYLARLRGLLNNEPRVRGLGYKQYEDEPEE